ncbi:N-acetylgalactosamine-6-O-sulfatase [Paraburkholderia metrosideri]|uniref:N-acetylgalactosamine-6-O-sulfatase n=1 Tax=Paraburkholderia metrosideri TaxID=580937 RepID=A0ABM8NQG2_9BURK|nr:N-acetylgalactosamine-6-O-sulfatase [Paraburkholderia metrosideri]
MSPVKSTLTVLVSALCFSIWPASAQTPKGWDRTVRVADNLEPAIPHPEQDKNVADKLRALESKTGRKPNILIILVDDMGYGDPGAYGGGDMAGAPTPNIDKLAQNGLKLTSTYTTPLCTPSRAALYTGRIPARSGLTRPLLASDRPTHNPWADEVSAAKLLSSNGYITGLSGKWHIGEGKGMQPQDVGFDEFHGFLSVVSEYTQYMDAAKYPQLMLNPDRLATFKGLSEYNSIVDGRKGGDLKVAYPLDTPKRMGNVDQDFANWSVDFMKRAAQANKPFYLVHAFAKVHFDNYPGDGYQGRSPAKLPYKDAVVEVDDIVGRLIQTLKDTGQEENTLVFFTSDNGPEEDSYPDSGYTPFRGGKGTTWEGGVRVPGIAYWPGMVKPGRVSDGLFDLMDLFNTSLDLAGAKAKIPKERYIDGVDQTGFLLSDNGETARQAVFSYNQADFSALRWGEFKAYFMVQLFDQPFSNISMSTFVPVGVSPWVFDIYRDPKERLTRSNSDYEWAYGPVLAMQAAHMATFKKYPKKDIGLGIGGGGDPR